jgi:hypothetical protein
MIISLLQISISIKILQIIEILALKMMKKIKNYQKVNLRFS